MQLRWFSAGVVTSAAVFAGILLALGWNLVGTVPVLVLVGLVLVAVVGYTTWTRWIRRYFADELGER